MKRTQYFLPTLKETPKEAEIVSHQLMLRAGMIRQLCSGIYSWLPLGLKVLRKVEQIVREEQNASSAIEMLMPTLQPAELWIKSGRYEGYGKEMLRIQDRHERDLLYGPTNEEVITDIVRQEINSYKDLPKNLYHIQWKFRDEIRPRFGLMRGREFLMKDNYSFDIDEEAAKVSYYKMFLAYLKTFAKIGVKAIPMRADTGPIGGDLSHEFIILAETGESGVYCEKALLDMNVLDEHLSYDQDLEPFYNKITSHYAATDEIYDEATCPIPKDKLAQARGIEVGHIFYFGTKYSEPLGAVVKHHDGSEHPVHMGSYGVGISRIVAAVIESYHDEYGMIWPESITPFHFGLINLKTGDAACDEICEKIYKDLQHSHLDVLYDDRDERAGAKFADMDLIGLPWQIIVGPKGLKDNQIEIKCRKSGKRFNIPIHELHSFIIDKTTYKNIMHC